MYSWKIIATDIISANNLSYAFLLLVIELMEYIALLFTALFANGTTSIACISQPANFGRDQHSPAWPIERSCRCWGWMDIYIVWFLSPLAPPRRSIITHHWQMRTEERVRRPIPNLPHCQCWVDLGLENNVRNRISFVSAVPVVPILVIRYPVARQCLSRHGLSSRYIQYQLMDRHALRSNSSLLRKRNPFAMPTV